jgi:hypothetical protein
MRSPKLVLALLVFGVTLTGCHSTSPPKNTGPISLQVKDPQTALNRSEAPANSDTRPRPAKQKTRRADQLNFDTEGGVRDGSYAMWVHVARHGRPLSNLEVVAYNVADKAVASARTNKDGDAMLEVQAATYRVVARQGSYRQEQTVTYHPGDQFELDLQP